MKIPKTIKIGSRTVEVVIGKLDETLFGQFDPREQIITLNETNTASAQIETFWHELIHAINDYNRLDLELAQEIARDGNPDEQAFDLEEKITSSFATVFLQVITDNNLLALTAK